jgi:hypothetical protein
MFARRTKSKIASAPRDDAIVVLQDAGIRNAGQRMYGARLQPGEGAIVTTDEPYFFDFPTAFRQFVLKLPRGLIAAERLGAGGDRSLVLSAAGARLLRKLAVCSLEEPFSLSSDEEVGLERAFAELLHSAICRSVAVRETAACTALHHRASVHSRAARRSSFEPSRRCRPC